MRKIVSVFFVVVWCTLHSVWAQKKYGNEWIVPSQTYFKIKISQPGLYRLDSATLAAAGVPVATIDPRNLHLFNNGKALKIWVEGSADGTFNGSDYVQFIGKKTDGQLDSPLYIPNSSSQPHTFYNLFTDTNAYFLTWNNTPGLRMTWADGRSITPGVAPEPWYLHRSDTVFRNRYNFGKPVVESVTRSDYENGEGWMGSVFSWANPQSRTFNTNFYQATGPQPQAEVLMYGISDGSSATPPFNHHIKVQAGRTTTTLNNYVDTLFTGYSKMYLRFPMNAADINTTTTRITVSVINDLGASADNNQLAFMAITYPRGFNWGQSTFRFFNLTGTGLNPSNYIRIQAYGSVASGKTRPLLFDVTNGTRILGTLQLDSFKVMVPGSGTTREMLLLDSTDIFYTAPISPVTLTSSPVGQSENYLILTHNSLLSGAQAYANYRNSPQGGSYTTRIVDVNQLYDQFYYGLPSPLAIKNYLKLCYDSATVKPAFLFFIGKGFQANLLRDSSYAAQNLVPSYGVPSSDVLFTAGFDTVSFAPALPTGRLSARTNNDIQVYLSKIQALELASPALWQKQVLHVTGAKELWEFGLYSQYLKQWGDTLSKPFFGANVTAIDKLVTQVTTVDAKADIVSKINEGVAIYNYFGHGSALVLSVDMGMPNEYNNAGKYPIMFFNGCSVGDCFTDNSLGELFLFEPNRGASGWLAGSNLAYPVYLGLLGNNVQQYIAKDMYGAPIGKIIQKSLKDFQQLNNPINLLHIEQLIFQGDPAMRLYHFDQPDFQLDNASLYITPENTNALSDSFALNIVVKNIGRAVSDSFAVAVARTLPDGNTIQLPVLRLPSTAYMDTIVYWIKSKNLATKGLNRFIVTVDSQNEIPESNESNNTAALDFFMPSNGINLLYPAAYGIHPSDSIRLMAQASNLQNNTVGYVFEIDTLPNYTSAWVKRFTLSPQSTLAESPLIQLLPTDSMVYYWRAKLDVPVTEGGFWEERSFTVFKGSNPGWNQQTDYQRKGSSFFDLIYDSTAQDYAFKTIVSRVKVNTKRWSTSQLGIAQDNLIINPSICANDRFIVAYWDTLTLSPVRFFYPCRGISIGYKAFDVQNDTGRTNFMRFVRDSIPAAAPVAMFNRLSSRPDLWRGDMLLGLAQLGVDTQAIKTITNDSTSFVAFGKKGLPPGAALQNQYYNPDPATDSAIFVNGEIKGKWYEGTITSDAAGPATRWDSLTYDYMPTGQPLNDSVTVAIIGVAANRAETRLDTAIITRTVPYSLRYVDPKLYPYLKVSMYVYDTLTRTAAQPKRWTITYQSKPEGTIVVDNNAVFYKDSLPEGDTAKYAFRYKNISPYVLDTVLVEYRHILPDRSQKVDSVFFPPLAPGQSIPLTRSIGTKGLLGTNGILLNVNPGEFKPEQFLFNNIYQRSFFVSGDRINPSLQVTFDGRNLFNGDIVSPNTQVVITGKDENIFLPLSDTSGFNVSIRKPGSMQAERLWFTKDLTFTPATANSKATVMWNAKALVDGDYDLTVQLTDRSGNPSGNQPYAVSFKVINESMISNVYPYPNPFTTSTRFVFTVTGSDIPDDLMISVYTVSGKMVKQITAKELGPIHIGNNISEYAWDGTDTYGDRLANGVYLYRVSYGKRSSGFKRFTTAGDKYFEKGFGKLYLIR